MSNISWEQCRCDWTAILHCIYIYIYMDARISFTSVPCLQISSPIMCFSLNIHSVPNIPWFNIILPHNNCCFTGIPIFRHTPISHQVSWLSYIPFILVISIFPPLYPSTTTIVAHVPIKSIAGHSPQVLWKWTFAAMSLTWRSGCGQFPSTSNKNGPVHQENGVSNGISPTETRIICGFNMEKQTWDRALVTPCIECCSPVVKHGASQLHSKKGLKLLSRTNWFMPQVSGSVSPWNCPLYHLSDGKCNWFHLVLSCKVRSRIKMFHQSAVGHFDPNIAPYPGPSRQNKIYMGPI